jgi:hypothetical protein
VTRYRGRYVEKIKPSRVNKFWQCAEKDAPEFCFAESSSRQCQSNARMSKETQCETKLEDSARSVVQTWIEVGQGFLLARSFHHEWIFFSCSFGKACHFATNYWIGSPSDVSRRNVKRYAARNSSNGVAESLLVVFWTCSVRQQQSLVG